MSNKNPQKLYPPATIGIVGGGQLGRMFVFEAKRMGYGVVVLDPNENSPAGQVADEQIVAGFRDMAAYFELANKTDVITFEFEHIDAELLAQVEQKGYRIVPSSKALEVIQNKYRQKTFLKEIGAKVPEFSLVHGLDDLRKKFESLGRKAILKSCKNGYDGKGNRIIKSIDEVEKAFYLFGEQEIFIEELIDFTKEVSILMIKNDSELLYYPVSENVHKNSILIKTLVPARIPQEVVKKIHNISETIAAALDDIGVYCIEFFVDKNFEVFVNEIAPRPHNSGHYTIEGCISSQFEQLVRVVCGMPAGSAQLRMPCAMYNILGNNGTKGEYVIDGLEETLKIEDCHFHLYGKPDASNLRKIGHITALGETRETADHNARNAMDQLHIRARKMGRSSR